MLNVLPRAFWQVISRVSWWIPSAKPTTKQMGSAQVALEATNSTTESAKRKPKNRLTRIVRSLMEMTASSVLTGTSRTTKADVKELIPSAKLTNKRTANVRPASSVSKFRSGIV